MRIDEKGQANLANELPDFFAVPRPVWAHVTSSRLMQPQTLLEQGLLRDRQQQLCSQHLFLITVTAHAFRYDCTILIIYL